MRAPAVEFADSRELLEHSPWFESLSESGRSEVCRTVLDHEVRANCPLGSQGELPHYWYGVVAGLLKWSVLSVEGRSVTIGGQSVGSWFGEGTLLRGRPRNAELIALRPSRVALVPFETFAWLRKTEPSFNEFLLRQLNERMHWLLDALSARRLLDAEKLVARALSGLVDPLINPLGVRFLQISQEELANLADVSRQRCNEILTQLKRDHIVELEYGAIRILDAQTLQTTWALG
ncbi:Crp/Fnr family transcriptional regulator [Ramlibacter sp. AW1]|uniref:Crp/Fnr family transcriptional regulator n=2 Tax=Ramlibacter aurantiacus TaxID=2801330 RepID=A0A936ZPB1_9BURK|nr:Crp/Fnr family transcriptional regulator [Ramlibacter aurantiacus]